MGIKSGKNSGQGNNFLLIIAPTLFVTLYLFYPSFSLAGEWINPKDAIGNPEIARLQQGRKKLTLEERQELEKFGYTGLEIMTYLDDNKDPGKDYDVFERITMVTAGGHIRISDTLKRVKHYYNAHKSLLIYDGIKPGDIEHKRLGVQVAPQKGRGGGFLALDYLTSIYSPKDQELWFWDTSLRRVRHTAMSRKDDSLAGSDITMDDFNLREPWEENHRILGIDNIKGRSCFVIESRNINNKYYLSKRVTWVEKENFLDLHEEQFGKKGNLLKIMDKEWVRAKPPWNYWIKSEWDIIDISTKHRTIYQLYDWVFDQSLEDELFSVDELIRENFWRRAKNPPPWIEDVSQLPSVPKIREEFWQRLSTAN